MKLLAYFRSMGEKFFRRSQLSAEMDEYSAATLRCARKTWNVPDWIRRKRSGGRASNSAARKRSKKNAIRPLAGT